MTTCVETFSITQLKQRKLFLEDQLSIVNNLIDNYEKQELNKNNNEMSYISKVLDDIDDEIEGINKNIERKKVKIKIKK